MADIGKGLKNTWMKSMEAIGNTASSIANNTRFKVNEMKLVNRRHEILSDFGARAYEVWQKGGTVFPEPLEALMRELSDVDEELNTIRAEHLALLKETEKTESADPEPAAEEAAAVVSDSAETEEMEKAVDDVIQSIHHEDAPATAEAAAEEIADEADAETAAEADTEENAAEAP